VDLQTTSDWILLAARLRELAAEDIVELKCMFRMSTDGFGSLLRMVGPLIQKEDT